MGQNHIFVQCVDGLMLWNQFGHDTGVQAVTSSCYDIMAPCCVRQERRRASHLRAAHLNWASQRLVGNVWCTPRYLDVYVRPVLCPLTLATFVTFWTDCRDTSMWPCSTSPSE